VGDFGRGRGLSDGCRSNPEFLRLFLFQVETDNIENIPEPTMDANADEALMFIPPLANLLADAEQTKGSRLTEPEVESIRNIAYCQWMPRAEAMEMEGFRGFHDVEPENCWADWHRLRVSMTGKGLLPQIVLCVPGDVNLLSRARSILEADGIANEWREHDDKVGPAFEACARCFDPSLGAEDFASIADRAGVLYVLSKNFAPHQAPAVSRSYLELGRRLLEAGGLALKCESSGIGHGRSHWLELAEMADGPYSWYALFRAFVQHPIKNGDDSYTCGMHLLGQPELIVSNTLVLEAYGSAVDPVYQIVDLFRNVAVYLLGECPVGEFRSGQTISTAADAPSFQVRWEACTTYDEDHLFFNPYGRWRFAEAVS